MSPRRTRPDVSAGCSVRALPVPVKATSLSSKVPRNVNAGRNSIQEDTGRVNVAMQGPRTPNKAENVHGGSTTALSLHRHCSPIPANLGSACLWLRCTATAESADSLVDHLLDAHGPRSSSSVVRCQWSGCGEIIEHWANLPDHFAGVCDNRRMNGEYPNQCTVHAQQTIRIAVKTYNVDGPDHSGDTRVFQQPGQDTIMVDFMQPTQPQEHLVTGSGTSKYARAHRNKSSWLVEAAEESGVAIRSGGVREGKEVRIAYPNCV